MLKFNKHFTDKLLYEYYQILSKIRETGVTEDEELIFDDIYKNILSDTEISSSPFSFLQATHVSTASYGSSPGAATTALV